MPASAGASTVAAARASSKFRRPASCRSLAGSESALTSTAKCARPSRNPRKHGADSIAIPFSTSACTHPRAGSAPSEIGTFSRQSGRNRLAGSPSRASSQLSSRRSRSPRSSGLPANTCPSLTVRLDPLSAGRTAARSCGQAALCGPSRRLHRTRPAVLVVPASKE